MATLEDKRKLEILRARHGGASGEWSLSRTGEELLAQLAPRTQPVAIATLSADCAWYDRDFLLNAHRDMAFLLRLLADAFAVIREMRDQHNQRTVREDVVESPNYAAECAMKCAEQLFRRYLIERHGMQDAADSVRIATHVRKILAVTSRNELNVNPEAAERWKEMRADFNFWSRT
jgi:hypothetical protein